MRVYLAASMTFPAQEMATVRALLAYLEERGHWVPSRHVADPGEDRDATLPAAWLAARDLVWLSSCQLLVAEVSTPSHGVGVEIAAAVAVGVPVLALAREGVPVSRLLAGLPGVRLARYRSRQQAVAHLEATLQWAGLRRRLSPPRRVRE